MRRRREAEDALLAVLARVDERLAAIPCGRQGDLEAASLRARFEGLLARHDSEAVILREAEALLRDAEAYLRVLGSPLLQDAAMALAALGASEELLVAVLPQEALPALAARIAWPLGTHHMEGARVRAALRQLEQLDARVASWTERFDELDSLAEEPALQGLVRALLAPCRASAEDVRARAAEMRDALVSRDPAVTAGALRRAKQEWDELARSVVALGVDAALVLDSLDAVADAEALRRLDALWGQSARSLGWAIDSPRARSALREMLREATAPRDADVRGYLVNRWLLAVEARARAEEQSGFVEPGIWGKPP